MLTYAQLISEARSRAAGSSSRAAFLVLVWRISATRAPRSCWRCSELRWRAVLWCRSTRRCRRRACARSSPTPTSRCCCAAPRLRRARREARGLEDAAARARGRRRGGRRAAAHADAGRPRPPHLHERLDRRAQGGGGRARCAPRIRLGERSRRTPSVRAVRAVSSSRRTRGTRALATFSRRSPPARRSASCRARNCCRIWPARCAPRARATCARRHRCGRCCGRASRSTTSRWSHSAARRSRVASLPRRVVRRARRCTTRTA